MEDLQNVQTEFIPTNGDVNSVDASEQDLTSSVEHDINHGDESAIITSREGEEANQQDITQSQAFSKRLSEMTAKERAKVESEYRPQVEKLTKLEKIAQEFGFANVDDYVIAVEQQAEQRRAEQEAQKMNVDLDTYNQYFNPVNKELQSMKQQLDSYKQAELNRQVRAELAELESDPLFAEHKEAVIDLAIKSGYKLKDAFKIATYEARVEYASKQKEQEVLSNVMNRDGKQVVSANDKGNTSTNSIFDMSSKQMADIERRVLSGERITADKLR